MIRTVTTAAPPGKKVPADQQFSLGAVRSDFDPDSYRMSVGDHLEELRSRLIKAMVGVFVAFFGGLIVAKGYLLPFVAGPLIAALKEADVTPQMFFTNVTDPFFVYLRLSMIAAFVVAGPWVLWQAWQFVAAGLYRHERKAVTRYLPLSLLLFFGGIAFAWYAVLPWTLTFFLSWSMTIPMPDPPPTQLVPEVQGTSIAVIDGDPLKIGDGQIWFNRLSQQLKIHLNGEDRVLAFNPTNLAAPIITLPQYVNLVMLMLVMFGVSFQIPIVVMALIRTGLVQPNTLREQRRYVYFVLVVAACIITPGDVIIMTLSLIGPLILLYEAGIWLGERGARASQE